MKNVGVRVESFVQAYLVSKNATRAAIAAGYSAKSAGTIGARLLKKVEVKELIESRLTQSTTETAYFEPQEIFKMLKESFDRVQSLDTESSDFYKKKALIELSLKSIFEIAKMKGMYKTQKEDNDSIPEQEYHYIIKYLKSIKKMSDDEKKREIQKWDELNTLPQ